MKKLIPILLGTILISSCQSTTEADVKSVGDNLTFFKKNNLCFATVGSMDNKLSKSVSITYVPCDSIKNVNIEKLD